MKICGSVRILQQFENYACKFRDVWYKIWENSIKVVLVWSRESKLASIWIFFIANYNLSPRILNAMMKVIFLLFCYFLKKIADEYLLWYHKKISSISYSSSPFLFFLYRKFHCCDGKLIRAHKSQLYFFPQNLYSRLLIFGQ